MYACRQRWMLFVLAMLTFRHFDFLVRLVRTKFNPTFCYWNIPSYVKKKNNSGIIPSVDPSTIPISSWKENWAWWHHRCAISPWDPMKSSRVSGGVLWWFFMIFPRAWTRITWCLIYVLNRLESVGFFLCWICWVQTCRIRPLLTPSWGRWSFRPSFTVSFTFWAEKQSSSWAPEAQDLSVTSRLQYAPVTFTETHGFDTPDTPFRKKWFQLETTISWVSSSSFRPNNYQFYPSRHNFPFRNCCQIRVSGKNTVHLRWLAAPYLATPWPPEKRTSPTEGHGFSANTKADPPNKINLWKGIANHQQPCLYGFLQHLSLCDFQNFCNFIVSSLASLEHLIVSFLSS